MEKGKIVITFKSGREKVFEAQNALDICKRIAENLNMKETQRDLFIIDNTIIVIANVETIEFK